MKISPDGSGRPIRSADDGFFILCRFIEGCARAFTRAAGVRSGDALCEGIAEFQAALILGKPVEPLAWEDCPAMEQLTISTWNVFAPYQAHARPFDFLAVGIISQDRKDIAACP
jgi:hypothetical protein